MAKRKISWAAREKRRQASKAIGGSFLKTITELLTNSDSALKKQLGLPHATGLVDAMLSLKPGDRLNTATLKKSLPKRREGKIVLEIYSKQFRHFPRGTCQVIDYGPGMTADELDRNFGIYAEAKTKGEQTRSLFGRGALDVFLYHSNQQRGDIDPAAHIFSVKDGILSHCRISWETDDKRQVDSMIDTKTLGSVTATLLKKHALPSDLTTSGTVVRFLLAEGRIPKESNLLPSLSNFYMLRLIAADPAMHVLVRRYRTEGWIEEPLTYDFDLGTVLELFHDVFEHKWLGEIPVDILIARSERQMISDPYHYEHRQNGLLFVDDNDAVLDLSLLPEYQKNPLLSRLYGIVKLTSIRAALETLLEDQYPVAILTETRDGFDTKNEITRALFAFIEKHVKSVYEEEEKRERRASGHRSADLDRRFKEALRELNRFHSEETDEEGTGRTRGEPEGPLDFLYDKVRLVAGQERRVVLYAERDRIHEDVNLIELTSSNTRVRVVPESEVITRRKGSRFQAIPLALSCAVAGETAIITATGFDVEGQDISATLHVIDVTEPPQIAVPTGIEFRPARYNGKPSVENQIVLLANLAAFPGMPTVKFRIVSKEGAVSIGDERSEKLELKVQKDWVTSGSNVAKIVIPYWGTAWGAKAEIEAKAKRKDGKLAFAICKVDFREHRGPNQYEHIAYEPIERPILGEVAGKTIYVNSKPPLHRRLFGESQETFDQALEENSLAQMRVASVVSDAVVYAVATKNYGKGGEKGFDIVELDPVTGVRLFVEKKRYDLEPKIVRAFVKEITTQ